MSSLSESSEPSRSAAAAIARSSSPASTPSPSSSSVTTATGGSAARRPPRKSTLTQQQKNNKRQRATQDQLVTLEVEFNKNPTPTAATRERIANDINMTERSVQIWFQNRRAKIKMLAKKSIETGEGCDNIPESMRHYLAMQFDPSKPGARDPLGRAAGYGGPGIYASDANSSGKVVISHFTCRSLSIGSWRRIGQNAMDLVIFYSPDKACMTYYINNDSAGYKIEYPFSAIKNITLETGDSVPGPNGAPTRPGGLVVELNRPPLFYMDSSNSGGFYQCGDFTEEQQASQIMVHHLGGHPKILSVQLAKLVSLESFQNRVAYNQSFAVPAVPASMTPPFIQRPASQPNQFAAAAYLNLYQDSNHLGFNMPAAARGHKRQRSRSVPAAVDLSLLHAPMPSYHMPQTPAPFDPAENRIYAPVPQSASTMPTELRIKTDTFGVDFRAHPLSATTAGSPTDFASPSMFSTAAHGGESTPVLPMSAQFNVPHFVTGPSDSPTLGSHTTSPYSSVSAADPMIANHSPPMSNMSHASSDMFGFAHDQQPGFVEDGVSMHDFYGKSQMNFALSHDVSSFELPIHGLPGHASPTVGDFSGNMLNLDEINSHGLPTGS
ncbi:Homeobox transcription factor RfeB-like protein [Penicillium ucsense]|uniref:Homeobox transcription factor RfeB-like protein n=1 Tax=Penicillium ucsense TaxID=2839758 RepID=A0A8J8VXH7_9EURO|nr:Homeobox transcription factor RfeB-like protein [Penicillium ucsense]KAF7730123.1 Homeobox transcription factor RfeB-like protein [Penicillium ucsense]